VRYLDGVTADDSDTVRAWLVPLLDEAVEVGLRTGFLTERGAELLVPGLKSVLDRGGRLHIVAGGHPDQSEPAALVVLAGIAAAYPGLMSLHLAGSEPAWQNAKTYYVRSGDDTRTAYVGSANLTRAGLESNYEAGVILHSDDDGAEAVDAVLQGIVAWEEHPDARPITPQSVTEFTAEGKARRSWRSGPPAPAEPSYAFAEVLPGALELMEAIGTQFPEGIMGVPTGFADLDALTNGLQPGTLTVIAARPSIGKSVLLYDICRSAAVGNSLPVALFTLGEAANDVAIRMLAAEARVPHRVIRSGMMSDDDWIRLAKRMAQIADAPLHLNETVDLSASTLWDESALLVADKDVKLVAIDGLQQIMPDTRYESREREVTEVVQRLRSLAIAMRVPVVVTAQLNRGPEQRQDKRPLLADLRDSDALARFADLVILVHREDAYYADSPRAGEADLIIAKHKYGPAATCTVAYQPHYQRFVDMAPLEQ
jgi:HKD family nuclease